MLRSRSVGSSDDVGSSHSVSWAGRQEKENMLQKFHSVVRRSTSAEVASTTRSSRITSETTTRPKSFALHDLCVEAESTDDIAWRDAVALLVKEPELAQLRTPEGWNPLHICCMSPVPLYMVRCLLYAYAPALAATDEAGRLPLHMLCASPYCDVEVLQLIVEEYPAALSTKDHQGIIPLHLLLRNTAVECTTERIGILLGWTLSTPANEHESPTKFRKRQQLQYNLATLEGWKTRSRPVTQSNRASAELESALPDVQAALRQLATLHVSSPVATFHNPATIPDPTEQLPLHQLVQRAIVLRLALDTRYLTTNRIGNNDGQPRPSVPQVMIALRMLISAYPEGLLCCNAAGQTPLSVVLSSQSITAPSVEIIEYLTGTRLKLEQVDEWAYDLPLARDSPATITSEDLQLPLHIAAEKWVNHAEIIRSVKEAYPAAIQQKDGKGRTPLHCCLECCSKSPVPVDVIELLFSDFVGSIKDDLGRTPLQVLIETKQFPWHEVSSSVYHRLLKASPVETPESLSVMPPWLRRKACGLPSIQAYILQALSHPVICSFILLDGVVLIALVSFLRLQLQDHFDFILLNTNTTRSWYTYAVYGTASLRLMLQAIVWILQGSSVPRLHFWSMINIIAMLSALATSVLLNGTIEEEIILQLGTASTGLLWLSMIGYLSTWWYSMAMFAGLFLQMTSSLLWAILVAGILVVAGSQMFYTFLLLDCETAIPGMSICTARESYRFVYTLLHGETLVEEGEWSNAAIGLVSVYFVLCLLWVAAVLLHIGIAAVRLDPDEVALQVFWEPQLATVLAFGLPPHQSDAYHPLERFWNRLTKHQRDEDNDDDDDDDDEPKASIGRIDQVLFRFLSIFLVPLWLLIGALTLGWLWPPQVREWLFSPHNFKKTSHPTIVPDTSQQLSQEIRLMKLMAYEKSIHLERELQCLRDLVESTEAKGRTC